MERRFVPDALSEKVVPVAALTVQIVVATAFALTGRLDIAVAMLAVAVFWIVALTLAWRR